MVAVIATSTGCGRTPPTAGAGPAFSPFSASAAAPVLTTGTGLSHLAGGTGLPHLAVPDAVVDPQLDLRSPPVTVPLELRIPSLQLSRPVLAVGITAADVMDAPQGRAQDPVWQATFWYRGGSIPGEPGTATIAGHVSDALGRPAAFAHLDELRPGDLVIVRDQRSGLNVSFRVDGTKRYSLAEAATPSVLGAIYGAGPVAGTAPQVSPDGLAHLTLITCTGTFDRRLFTHDHRLVVFATRSA